MSDTSPLAGLPGPFSLADELVRVTEGPEPAFAFLRIDIDHFAAYNQAYGYHRGDAVIAATGRLLADATALLRSEPRFAAHLGGDDFAVLAPPSQGEPVARWLLGAFDMMIVAHYDPEDRKNGFIEVLDRRGESQRRALLTVSIGVATTASRRIDTHWDAMAIGAEVLALAKAQQGSTYFLDRRRK
jgi:diguanylate cyclase (GGDEF)-like protein